MNDLQKQAWGLPVKKRRKSRVIIKLTHEQKLEAAKIAVDNVGGHRRKAAKTLGIHERTLRKWLNGK